MNSSWLLTLTIWLYVIPLVAQSQQADSSACFRIQGVLIDYATHQPLDAGRLLAKTANGRINVSASGDSGRFSGTLPCGTTALIIERVNYRSQIVPVRLPANRNAQAITMLIPLVPIDKQNRDTPYLQTEQTSYVQQDSTTSQSISDSVHSQHSTFLITDAIQNKPLSATVCFFYTKTGEKRCLGTNSKGWFTVDFARKDIIALEVRAVGYQPYAGNLIVEQLNGESLKHEIRLQRELTLFSVNAPEATSCKLRTSTETVSLRAIPGYKNQYAAYELTPGSYELAVSYGNQVIRRPVRLTTGLNVTSINQPTAKAPPALTRNKTTAPEVVATEVTAKPVLSLPDTIPMIYFEQGRYQLRPDSQDVLLQVARYLKTNPAFRLAITGHTDNVGNPQINQTLSQYRSLATAKFLTDRGIPDSQLIKMGIGSKEPIAPNDTEANRALNRRVSLKLTTTQ